MMNKETYATPKLTLIVVKTDLIRTSTQAPDVYMKDPFVQD